MKQNKPRVKSSTNHITGEKNVSINSENEAVVANKKSNINLNKTVIGGLSAFSIIITLLINAIAIGVMIYTTDTKVSRLEQEISELRDDTDKKFMDTNYTISDLCIK